MTTHPTRRPSRAHRRSTVRFPATFLVLLFLTTAAATAGDWEALLAERLEESVEYREAVLDRRAAEVRAGVRSRSLAPYLEIGTGQDGIAIEDGELQPVQLRSTLALRHVFGATIEVGVPFLITDSEDPTGSISLRVSRPLFSDDGAALPEARAALLRARNRERSAYLDVKLDLVEEILDARYSTQLLDANRANLRVLERVYEAAVDPQDRREVSRRILQMERGILQAEYRLQGLDAGIRRDEGNLYGQVLALSEVWLLEIEPEMLRPELSPRLLAQEYELAAAQFRGDRSFLPWVPNPVFRAGINYDPWEDTVQWSFSVQFDATLLDRGERRLEAMRRREQAEIERLRLHRLTEVIDREVADLRHRLEILNYDRRLKELDIEDEQQNVREVRALYEAGFETEENLIVAETDLSVEELALIQIEHNFMLGRLELLRYVGEHR